MCVFLTLMEYFTFDLKHNLSAYFVAIIFSYLNKMYYLVKENNEFFDSLFHFELKKNLIKICLKYVIIKMKIFYTNTYDFVFAYHVTQSKQVDLFRLSLK
jgi:hypothetical protein